MAHDEKDNELLSNIKNSILEMQSQMQSTYSNLSNIKLIGESHDKTVKIIMSATYEFEDIEIDTNALKEGVKEFKWRIREAWKELSKKIQETTQRKTLELLQGMNIPDEIRNIGTEGKGDREE